VPKRRFTIALIGNPNCGKTSLFNQLTGASQRTGNMPGVTVAARFGEREHQGVELHFVDLPGIYSLSQNRVEERVARDYLHHTPPDLVLNVLDASHLGRHLVLTTQLLEQGVPMLLALNMLDEARRNGIHTDLEKLSQQLGLPVLPSDGRRRTYLEALLDALVTQLLHPGEPRTHTIRYDPAIECPIDALVTTGLDRWQAVRLLEADGDVPFPCNATQKRILHDALAGFDDADDESPGERLVHGRYQWIHQLLQRVERRQPGQAGLDDRLDRWALNQWLGVPLFFAVIWLMFEVTFTLGQVPADWIDTAFVGLGNLIASVLPDSLLKALLVDGIISGVGGVMVFLPNVVLLFLFMELIEQSGYMARATFLADRLMSRVGLHGKALVPLVMGFGCNVPAIMATRSIEEPRARLITILINPFMSCSARLPVMLLLSGVFFPQHAGTALFGIYVLGVVVAFIVAMILSRSLPAHYDETFIIELPPWRFPTLRSLLLHLWERSRFFLTKAGTVILFGSMLIWLLQTFPQGDTSWLEQFGHWLTPLFTPLGFTWHETVALLSGFVAKEVIVSTLGVVYHAAGDNSAQLAQSLSATLDPAAGLALMVFTLLYMPCLATMAVIRREAGGWRWTLASTAIGLVIAWCAAWVAYSLGSLWI
jgi:ferrous iron transport protein B